MIDAYTKVVLTIIAAALGAIAVQMAIGPASAQLGECGSGPFNACHVQFDGPVEVFMRP